MNNEKEKESLQAFIGVWCVYLSDLVDSKEYNALGGILPLAIREFIEEEVS